MGVSEPTSDALAPLWGRDKTTLWFVLCGLTSAGQNVARHEHLIDLQKREERVLRRQGMQDM
jgi:hypothetical protein